MKLAIGNKIKSLRKKRNLTQEQLGEHLGISFQSISKWENNIALPDITLVPKIAAILGISIDELFDYDLKEVNEKIKSICNEAYECRWNDDFEKEKEILLEGLKDYANNETLLNNYLYTINYKENPEEVIAIAEKLVAETTDDTIKYNALRFLSYAYYTKGELKYAKATLEQIPELYFTKLSEMAYLLDGKEKFEVANKQKWASYDTLLQMLQKIYEYYISSNDIDKAVKELESAINLLDVFNDSRFENYREFFNKELSQTKNNK